MIEIIKPYFSYITTYSNNKRDLSILSMNDLPRHPDPTVMFDNSRIKLRQICDFVHKARADSAAGMNPPPVDFCPVGCGCRIHRLQDKISTNEYPGYDTKQSDGEVPVMLELWGMQSTALMPSPPG